MVFQRLAFNIGDPSDNIENIFIFSFAFNIGEARNNIESCEYQCVSFSIMVIKVLILN